MLRSRTDRRAQDELLSGKVLTPHEDCFRNAFRNILPSEPKRLLSKNKAERPGSPRPDERGRRARRYHVSAKHERVAKSPMVPRRERRSSAGWHGTLCGSCSACSHSLLTCKIENVGGMLHPELSAACMAPFRTDGRLKGHGGTLAS